MAKKGKFRKRCKSCGTEYDIAAFLTLPLPANGRGEAIVGGVAMLFRNCLCGSTLAIQVTDISARDGATA